MERVVLITLFVLFLFACSDFTQKNLGDLGEPCFENGKCNGDLVCVDKVCVEAAADTDTVTDGADVTDLSDSSDSSEDTDEPVGDDVTDSSDVAVDDDTVIVDEDRVVDDDGLFPDADTDTSMIDCGPSPTGKGGPMCAVPGGDFWMGCNTAVDNECESDGREAPYHKVTLDAYLIDQYAVTNEEYQACVDAMVCTAKHYDDGTCYIYDGTTWVYGVVPAQFRGATNPVVCVTWDEAKTYCEWAGKRLPTEAEWEKAARGTEGWKYPWGNLPFPTCEYAVMNDPNAGGLGCGTNGTLPVGSRPKGISPYGVYGMIGNVWEWVNDWYASDYYASSPTNNPTGPETGACHVMRGGAWDSRPDTLRASSRLVGHPGTFHDSAYGFRCAK